MLKPYRHHAAPELRIHAGPDAHPEDRFVYAFVAHVEARGGNERMVTAALHYAQDIVGCIDPDLVVLGHRNPAFAAVALSTETTRNHMLVGYLRELLEPSIAGGARTPTSQCRDQAA